MPPAQAMKNAKYNLLPHCAGETQTWLVKSIIATIPKLVGLKMCFRPRRKTNLLTIVTIAIRTASARLLVRSNRQSERPEISGLRGSKNGRQDNRVQAYCVSKTVPNETTICGHSISNPSQPTP